MNKLDETLLTSDISSAMILASITKFIKFLLAFIILIAYFFNFTWLNEILIFAIFLNLLLPMNFFDVFIQKLLEYNTQKVEERILLNAQETNKYFEENDKFQKSLSDKIKNLNSKILVK